MFKLTIKTNNDAFADSPSYEVARILRQAADKIERGGYLRDVPLFDINGNKVGKFELT